MTGIVKGLAITAPAILVIFATSWFLNRETTTELRADDAAFDRDFAYAQAQMSPGRDTRLHYMQQSVAAQSRYSSANADFQRQKQNIENRDKQINVGVDETESDLQTKLKKEGK